MFNGYMTMGAGGWVLMAVLWVALLAVIAWALVRLWPAREGREKARDAHEAPGEILDRRLASGELDAQTYQQLRSMLGPRSRAGER
jgi:putative membrane protein